MMPITGLFMSYKSTHLQRQMGGRSRTTVQLITRCSIWLRQMLASKIGICASADGTAKGSLGEAQQELEETMQRLSQGWRAADGVQGNAKG
jgi:hypothetical protein